MYIKDINCHRRLLTAWLVTDANLMNRNILKWLQHMNPFTILLIDLKGTSTEVKDLYSFFIQEMLNQVSLMTEKLKWLLC